MFRFFRSIRQRLLAENKTFKYLKYAVGEVLLVVIGILIALSVNDWNEGRLDRIEEREVLFRITSELEAILSLNAIGLEIAENKAKALHLVDSAFKGSPVVDASAFLANVAFSTHMSWANPPMRRSVFDETISSGKLGLIQNTELRDQIANFYHMFEMMNNAMTARVGDYAKLAYTLIPRGEDDHKLKEGISPDGQLALVTSVLNSDLKELIVYEMNRANYLAMRFSSRIEEIEEVLSAINTELNK